jgi:hypothetical protein
MPRSVNASWYRADEKSLLELGAVQRTQNDEKRRTAMNKQDRVLIRRGARELEPREVDLINGGLRTLTLCTIGSAEQRDGDVSLGEC